MQRLLFRCFTNARPLVFFEVSAEEILVGSMTFELRPDVAPKTCENFLQICEGTSEVLTDKGKKLHYLGSKIHRIVPGFLCQGGDLTKLNGKGGWSIYGPLFHDENFVLTHTEPGVLSMANQGPNTNTSQFLITFTQSPALDGKHLVFGKIVKGMDTLRKIEAIGTANGKPRVKVWISKCGILKE